jgi:ABC-type methionine transport system ATPase subunit
MAKTSKRVWLTFSGKAMVETPALWRMARQFPEVSFDIRQASVTAEIGIMAVLFEGQADQVDAALAFLRQQGVAVDPIEGSVVEG